jgi:ABC-2 type transport system ATP-binding protein
MRQRIGLACALLNDPDLVFLDEPTSALDPLGRREVREVLLSLKSRGKSVFLNSHLLGEVEAVCDHVEIINRGRVVKGGDLDALLAGAAQVRMEIQGITEALVAELSRQAENVRVEGHVVTLHVERSEVIPSLAETVVRSGARLMALENRRGSLEDLYVDLVRGGEPR